MTALCLTPGLLYLVMLCLLYGCCVFHMFRSHHHRLDCFNASVHVFYIRDRRTSSDAPTSVLTTGCGKTCAQSSSSSSLIRSSSLKMKSCVPLVRTHGLTGRPRNGTHRGIDIHHQVHHQILLRVVGLFESDPIPFRFLREATPSNSQSICPIVPHIPRVTLDILDANRLTRSLTSFEEGEEIINEFFVDDGFASGSPPTVLAPIERPFRQCCVCGFVVRIWRARGVVAYLF